MLSCSSDFRSELGNIVGTFPKTILKMQKMVKNIKGIIIIIKISMYINKCADRYINVYLIVSICLSKRFQESAIDAIKE